MFLLLKGLTSLVSNESFEFWAGENPEALQQLKERIYLDGQEHSEEKDMPVSEEIYRRIQNFTIKSA